MAWRHACPSGGIRRCVLPELKGPAFRRRRLSVVVAAPVIAPLLRLLDSAQRISSRELTALGRSLRRPMPGLFGGGVLPLGSGRVRRRDQRGVAIPFGLGSA